MCAGGRLTFYLSQIDTNLPCFALLRDLVHFFATTNSMPADLKLFLIDGLSFMGKICRQLNREVLCKVELKWEIFNLV